MNAAYSFPRQACLEKYFKTKITFCSPKHVIYKELRKMQDLSWCHMVPGCDLAAWCWNEMALSAGHGITELEKGECYSKDITHRTFIQLFCNKYRIKKSSCNLKTVILV